MKQAARPLRVVSGVDLERYQGVWYEIASMPSAFQPRDGRNSRATYRLQEGGAGATLSVLNETWIGGADAAADAASDADGASKKRRGRKRASIQGTAWQPSSAGADAKFLVRFWVPPFLPLFPVTGDYWIMRLDEEHYQWALVGQPSRKYLWVLSRTPQLNDEIYSDLVAYAESEGYDVSKLKRTEQDEAGTDGNDVNDKGTWWLTSMFGK